MIDLYVIKPEDKQGIEIDFQCKSTIENLADVIELCKQNHLLISSINVENEHREKHEKLIKLIYMNGSMIQIELKHNQIVFCDDGKLQACSEGDLEEHFGLTTDYRKANRYED